MASTFTYLLLSSLLLQILVIKGQDNPLQLIFRDVSYPNNSVLSLNDIEDTSTGSAILCTTNRSPCCRSPNRGEWYYPSGSIVPNNAAGEDFYRGRGSEQTIRLNRRNNAQSPTGSFCCELPDNSDVNHILCVSLVGGVDVILTSSEFSAVSDQYTLNCAAVITEADQLNPTITYQWFKNNTVVSGETQSTLSFFSLSLSDAGQYRCNVTVSSTLLSQSIIAMSNTQDLTLQIPPPTAVTVTTSPDGTIFTGSPLTLTCSIELSEAVDIAVTVNTVWSGPSVTQFTTTTSVATRMTATTYTSTATISSVETRDSGEYTCRATVSSISPFLIDSEGTSGMHTVNIDTPVQLIFQGVSYPNNSELFIGDIGDFSTGSAILCTTNKSPCCSTVPNRFGEWYYPNGSMVPNNAAGYSFYRGRGDDQTTWLSRRNNSQSPTGLFCCELPDNRDFTHRLCVYIDEIVFITPSGINIVGEQYQLTCTFISTTATPTIIWFGPPNDGPLPSDNSDTRMVSDVMSSGSTHTSILQFDPLQSSHEGNYICQVTVGTIVEMTSFQINVEALVTITTTQQPTTTPDKSSSTEGASSGTTNTIAIVAGAIVGLLVVVILSVMVAVIVMVSIFRRQHSTRNKSKNDQYNLAANTAYGPSVKSKELQMESEYEDMKTGNDVYEEIPDKPPQAENFDLATNVAYGPVQHSDTTITTGNMYDEITHTTPAASLPASQLWRESHEVL